MAGRRPGRTRRSARTKRIKKDASKAAATLTWLYVLMMLSVGISLAMVPAIVSFATALSENSNPVPTAGEKPSANDNAIVALPCRSHFESMHTESLPWPVARALVPYQPVQLQSVLSGSRPLAIFSQSAEPSSNEYQLALRPAAVAEVGYDIADQVLTEPIASHASVEELLANDGNKSRAEQRPRVVLARASRSAEPHNTTLDHAMDHHQHHGHTQPPVTFNTAWGFPCTVCMFTAAMLLMYSKVVRLQKRVEALEPPRPPCNAAGTPTDTAALYQHEYYVPHYEQQTGEQATWHDDRAEAKTEVTDYGSPPTLWCRGAALEVDETAQRLFPNLAIPPPTDPSLVRSIIKLTPMACDTGIHVPGYGLVTVMNARDILLALDDAHGRPGVSNRDLDVQLLHAATVVWLVGNMVSWADDRPDLNMLSCSGTLPPTPADLRRNMRHVTRKGLGEEEEEFRGVLQELMADDKHGQWRCDWQDGADGGSATIADCCYCCCAMWDGQAAYDDEAGYGPHLEYIVLSCQACACIRGRCGEFPMCMNCARRHMQKRTCPFVDNDGQDADHIASSMRTMPQTFLRKFAYM